MSTLCGTPASLLANSIWKAWSAGALMASVVNRIWTASRATTARSPDGAADADGSADDGADALGSAEADGSTLGGGVMDGAGAYVQPGPSPAQAATAPAVAMSRAMGSSRARRMGSDLEVGGAAARGSADVGVRWNLPRPGRGWPRHGGGGVPETQYPTGTMVRIVG